MRMQGSGPISKLQLAAYTLLPPCLLLRVIIACKREACFHINDTNSNEVGHTAYHPHDVLLGILTWESERLFPVPNLVRFQAVLLIAYL